MTSGITAIKKQKHLGYHLHAYSLTSICAISIKQMYGVIYTNSVTCISFTQAVKSLKDGILECIHLDANMYDKLNMTVLLRVSNIYNS